MRDANTSPPGMTLLWSVTAVVAGLAMLAAVQKDISLTYALLGLMAAYAMFGIGFGIWAAHVVARRRREG